GGGKAPAGVLVDPQSREPQRLGLDQDLRRPLFVPHRGRSASTGLDAGTGLGVAPSRGVGPQEAWLAISNYQPLCLLPITPLYPLASTALFGAFPKNSEAQLFEYKRHLSLSLAT